MSKSYAANVQVHSFKLPKNRRTHLEAIGDGVGWSVAYDCVRIPYHEGKFPAAKYRLLDLLLTTPPNFQIKTTYLRKIFSAHTLGKYMRELVDEGYITVEEIDMPNGGYRKIYHINSLYEWQAYKEWESYKKDRQNDSIYDEISSQVDDSAVEHDRKNDESLANQPRHADDRALEHDLTKNLLSLREEEKILGKAEEKTEDSESEKTEDTSPEHIAAVELCRDLKEHGINAKPLDVKRAIEEACRKRGCKPEHILEQKNDAIIYNTSRNEERNRPVWYLRNWLKFEFEYPRKKQLETNDAPKITPRQIGQVSQQISQADPRPKHIFREDLLTPEELAEEERLRKEELKIKIAAAKKKLGIKSPA